MPKVFAFDPPTGGAAPTVGSHKWKLDNIGTGTYYGALGMRGVDVEKRLRMVQKTGRDRLETLAAYNVEKRRQKDDR